MNVKIADLKKYVMPTIIVFIVITVFNIIFHGIIMEKTYLAYSHFFRPQDEIQKHKHYMWLANLIYSFAFCYIYSKGHEKKEDNLTQGFRYGLWVSLLIWIPQAIVSYTIFPYPACLQIKWLIGYSVQSIISGITIATFYLKVK